MSDEQQELFETNDEGTPIALGDKFSDEFEEPASALVAFIMSKFTESKSNKLETERRWLKAYTNFRGRYGDDIKFLTTEVSRVFIKVTKTKTLAAYGQLLDILLGGEQFPIVVEPTEKPLGVVGVVHIDPNNPTEEQGSEGPSTAGVDAIGFAGDGNDVAPEDNLMSRAKKIAEGLFNLRGSNIKLNEGAANAPGMITIDPAEIAAQGMTVKIQDQLTESNMNHEFRKFLFETVLLGSGCLKGPMYTEKEYPKWDNKGNYTPVSKIVPTSSYVSSWNIYQDNDATTVKNAEWIIERHRKSEKDLRDLKRQPFFRPNAVESAIHKGPNYVDEFWEQDIREGNDTTTNKRFEVLEYWGIMQVGAIRAFDLEEDMRTDEDGNELPYIELDDTLHDHDQVDVNAFICNGELLRLIVNPFKPSRIPYYVCPYEEDPYNFFGVGLPENMEDSQTLMNGFARMAVDNAVLAGHVMLEVDEDSMVPGQTMDMYAGKIWRRQGGNPGTMLNSISFPNTANTNMQLYDKFRQLSDESTGISSFSHGQTGVSGVGRTAAGISMLMNAASTATKTVIKNIDDYVLEPLGKDYFAFNMQFDYDEALSGDLAVKPLGAASLLQKEVRSQRLLQLLQITQGDPELSARTNKEYILKEIARSLELDPKKTVLSPEEAALKMALFPPQEQLAITDQSGGVGGPPPTSDQTGGGNGNIGVGAATQPGEQGFSGAPQESPIV